MSTTDLPAILSPFADAPLTHPLSRLVGRLRPVACSKWGHGENSIPYLHFLRLPENMLLLLFSVIATHNGLLQWSFAVIFQLQNHISFSLMSVSVSIKFSKIVSVFKRGEEREKRIEREITEMEEEGFSFMYFFFATCVHLQLCGSCE